MKKRNAVLFTATICLLIFGAITAVAVRVFTACTFCKGTGLDACFYCEGTGIDKDENGEIHECDVCDGEETEDCSECDGEGYTYSLCLTRSGMLLQLQRLFSDRSHPLVGDYVQYGSMEGNELIWRIIDKQNNDLLLLCMRSVAEIDHAGESDGKTWKTSKIRAWLNDDAKGILSDFAEDYREVLVETDGDRLSLLTEEQFENKLLEQFGVDLYEGSSYWLKEISKIDEKTFFQYVDVAAGKWYSTNNFTDKHCVRPVIRIPESKIAVNTSKLNIGTQQHPYIVEIAPSTENEDESSVLEVLGDERYNDAEQELYRSFIITGLNEYLRRNDVSVLEAFQYIDKRISITDLKDAYLMDVDNDDKLELMTVFSVDGCYTSCLFFKSTEEGIRQLSDIKVSANVGGSMGCREHKLVKDQDGNILNLMYGYFRGYEENGFARYYNYTIKQIQPGLVTTVLDEEIYLYEDSTDDSKSIFKVNEVPVTEEKAKAILLGYHSAAAEYETFFSPWDMNEYEGRENVKSKYRYGREFLKYVP